MWSIISGRTATWSRWDYDYTASLMLSCMMSGTVGAVCWLCHECRSLCTSLVPEDWSSYQEAFIWPLISELLRCDMHRVSVGRLVTTQLLLVTDESFTP